MAQQGLDRLVPHSVDLLQFAVDEVVASFLAVEGDAEAVCLVTQVADHLQRLAPAVQVVGHGVVREKDLLDAFRQSDDGHPILDSERTKDLVGARQLTLAAVDDNQVGQFGLLLDQPRIAPVDDLAHGGEVIGSDDGLDIEMTVLPARRLAVAEYHAGGDRMGPLQVGVVEALDVAGRSVEMQLLLHGGHQPFGMPFGILDLLILELLGPVDTGAFARELQQFELLAPLGDGEGHSVEEQGCGGQQGHHHLAGQLPASDLKRILNAEGQQLRLVGIDARGEPHGVDPDDRPVADADEVAVGYILVLDQQREDIDIGDLRTDNDRFAGVVVQRVEPLLVTLGHLELQFAGRPHHLRFEMGAHGAQVALQNGDRHADHLSIIRGALGADTGTLAVAQMVLQADAVLAPGDGLGREVQPARAQRNHLPDELQHAALHGDRPVGPEVLRTVAAELARGLDAREILVADLDPRVGLVILEQDVVARLETFNQRVLQQQGVGLGVHDDMSDLDDLLHQHTHLGAVLPALDEIGGDPFAEALGLADVDDRPLPVDELVDSRRKRKQGHLLLQGQYVAALLLHDKAKLRIISRLSAGQR